LADPAVGSAPDAAPARFVARFQAAWSSRRPEELAALLHPEVVLTQPLLPPARGREAARRSLTRVLGLLPDLAIEVHRWSASGDLVFIEFSFSGTLGGRALSWRLVDRITLSGGLVLERASYFDPLPLFAAVAARPAALLRLSRWLLGAA
jgi:ketosteroid isomerase-like protein